MRGTIPLRLECAPAFNYARDPHQTALVPDDTSTGNQRKALFESESLSLDLRYVAENSEDTQLPEVNLQLLDLSKQGHLGPGVFCELHLIENQAVTFVLRVPPPHSKHKLISKPSLQQAEELGVPLYRVSSVYKGMQQPADANPPTGLVEGASKLRPEGDPMLTQKLLSNLLKVCQVSSVIYSYSRPFL